MFTKGQIKPSGSGIKKGQTHKRTAEWHYLSNFLLTEGKDRFISLMDTSGDRQFTRYFIELLEYLKPREYIHSDIKDEEKIENFDNLTDEDLRTLIEISKKIEDGKEAPIDLGKT